MSNDMRGRRWSVPLAWLPDGWAADVVFDVDARGCFASIRTGADAVGARDATPIRGVMLPGIVNAHSHAFQRAMVGLTHRAGAGAVDNFWSWRTRMYALALSLTPEQIESIATWTYIEMLRGGYTHVCEFHYLHNDRDGRPYADPGEISRAMLRAAKAAGIGITLLPVLYMTSGFGGAPPRDEQRRFVSTPDRLLENIRTLMAEHRADPAVAFGIAPHSLRAVPPPALADFVAGLRAFSASAPIHIHIAEQMGEVDACLEWSGKRPVEWLLAAHALDSRWNLVHATHMSCEESAAAAASGAVVVLCPTTEADLGDGAFDYRAYAAANGRIAIGSDSQVSRDWQSELRTLEYSQRLALRQRNIAATGRWSSGERLFHDVALGGGIASGFASVNDIVTRVEHGRDAPVVATAGRASLGRIAPGARADWLVVRDDKLAFAGRTNAYYIDSLVFDHHAADFADVVVGGVSRRESLAGEGYRAARSAFVEALDAVRSDRA